MQPLIQIRPNPDVFDRRIQKISEFKLKAPAAEGVTRLGYSVQEEKTFRYTKWLMEQAGLRTMMDSAGNLFGIANGPREKAILIGSHLDSVPNGGRYDGVAGVLAAIEVVGALKGTNDCTLVAVAWRCEESSRFGTPYIGSKIAFNRTDGLFDRVEKTKRRDKEAITLAKAMDRLGYMPVNANIRHMFDIAGYFELHAEQGLVLEASRIPVGLVTHIAGNRRFDIRFMGKPDHTGGTMMGDRQDAMLFMADALLIGSRLADEYNKDNGGERTRNFTDIRYSPAVVVQRNGNRTTIASDVTVQFDVRSIDDGLLLSFMNEFVWRVKQKAKQSGMECPEIRIESSEKPVALERRMLDIQEESARVLEIPAISLPSGAGHDAKIPFMEGIDTGMFFIPSVGGWSHNPNESSRSDDWSLACRVMAESVARFQRSLDR